MKGWKLLHHRNCKNNKKVSCLPTTKDSIEEEEKGDMNDSDSPNSKIEISITNIVEGSLLMVDALLMFGFYESYKVLKMA
jgi:hypothetical protein